ncbi:MAG: DNA-binding protein, partial [Sphingobacteriia bacterium]|nr:DNA-binding protein [Sphingobacteriia bacterium]
AVNIALENAEARAKEEMAKITKDKIPNIPGLNLSNLGFPG